MLDYFDCAVGGNGLALLVRPVLHEHRQRGGAASVARLLDEWHVDPDGVRRLGGHVDPDCLRRWGRLCGNVGRDACRGQQGKQSEWAHSLSDTRKRE
jgi:hypothetical protein